MSVNQSVDHNTIFHHIPGIDLTSDVIVVGYDHCPYSDNVRRHIPIHKQKNPKAKIAFLELSRGGPADQFRSKTGYTGTFPLIFVRESNKWRHLPNGSTGYADHVNHLK